MFGLRAASYVDGFLLFEFLLYSALMMFVIGGLVIGAAHLYAWRERVLYPLVKLLAIERIMIRMERDIIEGPRELFHWKSGDRIGWVDASGSRSWYLRGRRLWYEHDGTRAPVLDDVVSLSVSIAADHGKVRLVKVELRSVPCGALCVYGIPRRVVI